MPLFIHFAQANAPAAGSDNGFLSTLVMIAPLVLLFYMIVVRPQQIQERKRRTMIDSLKANDEVLTNSGIYGTVVRIDAEKERVVLRLADNVRVTFARSSIAQILGGTEKEKPVESP